jgi:hypothetical protein
MQHSRVWTVSTRLSVASAAALAALLDRESCRESNAGDPARLGMMGQGSRGRVLRLRARRRPHDVELVAVDIAGAAALTTA